MIGIIYTGENKFELLGEISSLNGYGKIFIEPIYEKEFLDKYDKNQLGLDFFNKQLRQQYRGMEITNTQREFDNRVLNLTMDDIAEKFNTTPDKIKIVRKR